QRVVAVLPRDGVAAVAGVPHEGVITCTHEGDIVAGAAVDEVVAGAADQRVVAGAAVEDQVDRPGRQTGRVHHVFAALGVHRQVVVRPLRAGDVHQGNQAANGDARSVVEGPDLDGVVPVGAVDDDGIGRAVAAAVGAVEVQVDHGNVGGGQV